MKKLLIIVISVFTILIGGLVYFQTAILKETQKIFEDLITKETNLKISAQKILIDWKKLARLKPAIQIQNLEIANPPGFHSPLFASAQQISAELNLKELFLKEIKIKSIIVTKAQLNIEENSSGKTNLDIVIYELSKKPSPVALKLNKHKDSKDNQNKPLIEFEKLILNKFIIQNSQLISSSYKSGKRVEILRLDNLNFQANNFATDKSSNLDFGAQILGADLKYSGALGPWTGDTLASQGVLNWNWKISKIPRDLRHKVAGDLLLEPKGSDQVALSLQMKGDLLKSLRGPGSITINGIHIGKHKDRQIKLDGNLPIYLQLSNLQKIPSIALEINKSKLSINENSAIKLNLKTQIINNQISGLTQGSIEGVDINNLISALSDYRDKIHGKFQMPNFDLSFNGYDSKSITQSLRGSGLIIIEDGSFELIEKILKAKEIINQLSSSNAAAKPKELNKFTKMSLDWNLANLKCQSKQIEILSPVANIYGSGYFSLNNIISYQLKSNIFNREIPIEIQGNFEQPKISFKIEEVLKQELNKQLDTWINKLNEYQLKRKQLNGTPQ